jgi:hypothetical protein
MSIPGVVRRFIPLRCAPPPRLSDIRDDDLPRLLGVPTLYEEDPPAAAAAATAAVGLSSSSAKLDDDERDDDAAPYVGGRREVVVVRLGVPAAEAVATA